MEINEKIYEPQLDDATLRELIRNGVEAETLPEAQATTILNNIIKSLTEQDVLHEDNFQVGVNARDEMLVEEEIMDRVQDYIDEQNGIQSENIIQDQPMDIKTEDHTIERDDDWQPGD